MVMMVLIMICGGVGKREGRKEHCNITLKEGRHGYQDSLKQLRKE